jgi:restriction system protein
MARRGRSAGSPVLGIFGLLVLFSLLGWLDLARSFVVDRLPLFAALGLAVLVLLVLVLARHLRQTRLIAARQRQRDAQVASTDTMTGHEFERLVARLLTRDGYTSVRNPGGAGDLGADVLATSPTGRRVVVQCKRYAQQRAVSSPDMQRFLGTCYTEHDADEAWFVTTTRFSRAARDLGARRDVRLIDRDTLAVWMAEELPAPGR